MKGTHYASFNTRCTMYILLFINESEHLWLVCKKRENPSLNKIYYRIFKEKKCNHLN